MKNLFQNVRDNKSACWEAHDLLVSNTLMAIIDNLSSLQEQYYNENNMIYTWIGNNNLFCSRFILAKNSTTKSRKYNMERFTRCLNFLLWSCWKLHCCIHDLNVSFIISESRVCKPIWKIQDFVRLLIKKCYSRVAGYKYWKNK
jgi:hypothetical protein